MFRIKKIVFTIFVFICPFIVNAQHNEIGILLGTSYYLGDLNPSKQFFLAKPAGGIIYRYILNPRWAIKVDGLYGCVAGDDAKSGVDVERNLSFKSNIFEISPQFELNFLPYITGSKERDYFTPYIFGGFALFHFNPKAEYNGAWYALQPLSTEGEGIPSLSGQKPYSLTQVSIPFGFGFKYSIGDYICIGAEWGLRKTFTGYIDDVSGTYPNEDALAADKGSIAAILSDRSIKKQGETNDDMGLQRGNSRPDWYSFAVAFITFKFIAFKDNTCPAYGRHSSHYSEKLNKD
jgi:hypothetical protein